MSSSSPTPGRILRSHAKKPDETKEKDVKPQTGTESEKEKKKRKNKSAHNTSADDAHESENDVKINKPGKKKRKIHTRTAHSDGEQEFVELGARAKPLVKPKTSKDVESLSANLQTPGALAIGNDNRSFQNIMEPIYTLRATLANVLAKLPKPVPTSSNGLAFGNSTSSNIPFGDAVPGSSSSSNSGASSASSNLSTFSAMSANLNNMLNLANNFNNLNNNNNSNNNNATFMNNNNNNNNNNTSNGTANNANNNMFSQLQLPSNSQSSQNQTQQTSQTQGNFWGSLMSQYPHHPNISLSGASYSIGRRTSRCNLALPDDFLSTTLCKIHYSNGIATIESCSGSSSLQLNTNPIRKGYSLVLRSGDELSFTGSKHYSFIFQLFNTTNTSSTPNSSQPTTATSNTSSSTTSSSTTSTSSTPLLLTAGPSSSSSSSSSSATANPSSFSGSSSSTLAPSTTNGNTSTVFSFSDVEKSLNSPLPPDTARGKPMDMSVDSDSSLVMETDDSNISHIDIPSPLPPNTTTTTTSSDTLTPPKVPLSVPSDVSSPPPFSLSASAPTTTTTTTTPSQPEQNTLKETFKTELKDLIINPPQLTHTLEDFPYYLAKETKQMLISSAYLFLSRPEYVKYTTDLPSVSRRVLLEGPTGTDLYQEYLVKALAKQFNAQLLMLDHAYFETKEKGNTSSTSTSLSASTPLLQPPSTLSATLPAISSARQLPELSTEDDDSDLSSEEYGRRLTAFDVTKRRFKIDDRVKYTGPSPSSFVMNRHHSTPSALHSTPSSASTSSNPSSSSSSSSSSSTSSSSDPASRMSPHRGPQVGNKGKVVITFDDNPRRVGVRFDKSIAGGVDLGGLCEESHGFFVDTSEIKRESESADDRPDALAITALFEILAAATTPTILCIKDAEKVLLANYERYAHIKREFSRINKLPIPVLIIGTNITRIKAQQGVGPEARRGDKGHGSGLLFSKAASHHTALLDLSFFDHISRIEERAKETSKTTKFLYKMLSNKITITPPKDPATLTVWREKLERDIEQIKSETNQTNIRKALERNNIECPNLNSPMLKKQVFTPDNVEKIIGWALSHHLMIEFPSSTLALPLPLALPPTSSTATAIATDTLPSTNSPTPTPATPPATQAPVFASPSSSSTTSTITTTTTTTATTTSTAVTTKPEKLEIGIKSVEYAIEMLTSHDPDNKAVKNLKDVETENEFEKRILSEVIPPHEIAIRFEDIGALGKVKETLKELVMLPLQRPELFRKGNLTKPCKGILLFGPPGTGKTMLAKAVATESGANFINVSMSTIGSKWFGEGEKYAKAVFTLAGKIAPSVIFIDEVDSILGKRDRSGEHEAMRKIKNEFMSMWDGLRSRDGERVLVLAATNRPFDLDDAVLRRLSRRLMVDLPDQENRTKILQVILAKEDLHSSVDAGVLASMTEGYSGSDLKNLSIAAAYQPIREFLRQEKQKESENENEAGPSDKDKGKEKEKEKEIGIGIGIEKEDKEKEVQLRSITLADFVKAKDEVSPSVSEDAFSIAELRKWNDMYGEGGSRVKSTLSYFM